MDVGHHRAYKKAADLFCGLTPLPEFLAGLADAADDLEYVTALYGACIYSGSPALYGKLLARDGFWPCFAYIAAYTDEREKRGPPRKV
jgi:hypothetical protein